MTTPDKDNETLKKKWFDYPLLVILLMIFFFPVGFYALYRNRVMTKPAKYGLAGFIVVMLIGSLGGGEKETKNQPSAISQEATDSKATKPNQEQVEIVNRRNQSLVQCKYFVKHSLVSPTTADFPWQDEMERIHMGDQVYKVTGYVDSQNAYGATIRNNWLCKIKYLGGEEYHPANWDILELTFN